MNSAGRSGVNAGCSRRPGTSRVISVALVGRGAVVESDAVHLDANGQLKAGFEIEVTTKDKKKYRKAHWAAMAASRAAAWA